MSRPRQRKAYCYVALLLALMFGRAANAQLPDTLHLASTDWCPYSCANQPAMPGIVAEYVTEVLAREHISLQLTFLPWSRAVVEAQRGTFDGLLTAVADEAPSLAFTRTPISHYQDCLYAKPDSEWEYHGVESFANRRLGVVYGYGYTKEINAYIASANEKHVIALRGVNSTARLWNMLLLGRFDVFLEEQRAILWQAHVQQRNINTLQLVKCLTPQPFHLALYPGRTYSNELLTRLDRAFSDETNQVLWQQIQSRYLTQAEATELK